MVQLFKLVRCAKMAFKNEIKADGSYGWKKKETKNKWH